MTKNVGSIDRIVRIVAGIALLAWAATGGAALFDGENLSWIGWIGAVPLLTALMGWCPAYTLFGIKTCPAETAES